MKITFSPTLDDQISYSQHIYELAYKPDTGISPGYFYHLLVGATLFWIVVMGAVVKFEGTALARAVLSFVAGVSTTLVILYQLKPAVPTRRELAEAYRLQSDPEFYAEVTVELSEKGILGTREARTQFIRWEGVREVVFTNEHAFVHFAPQQAILIPKRLFADEAQWKELQEVLNSRGRHLQATDTRIMAPPSGFKPVQARCVKISLLVCGGASDQLSRTNRS